MPVKPSIIRLVQHPEREYRRGFLYPAGIAGLGNMLAAGFVWICLLADLMNSGTDGHEGKVLAAAIMLGMPVGLVWGWVLAAVPYYVTKWKPGPQPIGRANIWRWWQIVGRALAPLWLSNIAVCLDLILLDGRAWVEGTALGPLDYALWVIKIAGILWAGYLYDRLLRMRPGWSQGLSLIVVFASVLLAFAICFLIFVVLWGIPLR